MRLIKPLGLLLAKALLAPQGADTFEPKRRTLHSSLSFTMLKLLSDLIARETMSVKTWLFNEGYACLGWRFDTPEGLYAMNEDLLLFKRLQRLVSNGIPAQIKQPREYWQIKNRVNKRGQQLCFIDYYELPPYG